MELNPGDVIGVPAVAEGTWGFVLARIIRHDVAATALEIFRGFRVDFAISEDTVRGQGFSPGNRLFGPVYATLRFHRSFGKIEWPVLATDRDYVPSDSRWTDAEFEDVDYETLGIYYRGGDAYQEPPDQRRQLERKVVYSNPQLIHRVNLHLGGDLAVGEALSRRRERELVERHGMAWWTDGVNACNVIADAVALNFKLARMA